jgi:hypothetical protein
LYVCRVHRPSPRGGVVNVWCVCCVVECVVVVAMSAVVGGGLPPNTTHPAILKTLSEKGRGGVEWGAESFG